jgi:hypothetical protein
MIIKWLFYGSPRVCQQGQMTPKQKMTYILSETDKNAAIRHFLLDCTPSGMCFFKKYPSKMHEFKTPALYLSLQVEKNAFQFSFS